MDKKETSEKMQVAYNCRLLWLSVIKQALSDSKKKNYNNDLPRIIKTDWWKQIFSFADVEKEINKINAIILNNCKNHA